MEIAERIMLNFTSIMASPIVSDFNSKYFRKSVQDMRTDGDPLANYSYNMMTEFQKYSKINVYIHCSHTSLILIPLCHHSSTQ